jgi:hypothetical protein
MYKIIGADQKEYGPITAEQMVQWIAQSRVNAQTQVQFNGGDWKPLAQYPEFAAALGNVIRPAAPAAFTAPAAAYAPAPQNAPVKTNGMAIASLVCGILGFFTCGVTALVGLILGIVSMNSIKKSNGTQGGHGLALAGTIVSAVFLVMIPMWAALMLPALGKAKQKAQTVQCVNNMKQLALAVRIYSGDHNDHFPPATTWCDAIKPQVLSDRVFRCPAGDPGKRCHYAYNARLDNMQERNIDPETVLFFETDGGWNVSGGPELLLPSPRHGQTYVVAFVDGSVRQMTAAQMTHLRWNP